MKYTKPIRSEITVSLTGRYAPAVYFSECSVEKVEERIMSRRAIPVTDANGTEFMLNPSAILIFREAIADPEGEE